MLTIEESRKLIPNNEKYTDEEIKRIRDDLYNLADIALDIIYSGRRKHPKETVNSRVG